MDSEAHGVFRQRLSVDFARPALITPDGQQLVYGELLRRADAIAEQIGSRRTLVFLEASNSIDAICSYVGCLLGGHPVYLFADQDGDVPRHLIERYRPGAVLRPTRPEPLALLHHDLPCELHPDLALLLSTSGSTGSPKLVKLSFANITSNATAIAQYLEIMPDDRAMTSLPFAYSYGMSVINSHLMAGAAVLLNDAPISDPAFFDTFRQNEATSFAGVPYSFDVLSIADPSWAEIPSLRYVTQAGGRLDPQKVRHFVQLGAQHGWNFHVMYGQTECAPRIAHLPPELAEHYPDCIGIPVPGGAITLIDSDGGVIGEAGRPGELVYSGPNVMMGYAESADDLASGRAPAPHHTGDLACRNEIGLYRIVGRLSRLVKPYGIRVNLDELQAVLRETFPGVVCTGSDARIVVVRPDRDPGDDAAIAAFLASRLKLPEAMFQVVRAPKIPLRANGKIDFGAIEALAAARLAKEEAERPGAVRTILSARFAKQIAIEAGQILGIIKPQWRGVRHIYGTILNLPAVDGNDTFVSLAGDSLSYVQTSVALTQYLGHLPLGWENAPVDVLEQESPVAQAF
ncbi:AMP-binding protein [Sphingomonas nostoxanthinifaciens]|uniref:AMP-binding protein n=1 Tax=Sphingomonas nostoxanthinifaciens TaxID=2872652 RepID=UPI001CC1D397|nr:AMP-binding protein [Sphingomonas nostoxanthinifaciens]UAK25060.1 AMP-binding protein [Sphingomonas nostoxanthinifaciens]